MFLLKAIVINAGPKRRDGNAQLVKEAARGAESVGASVKYVDLYKLDLHGCMNCGVCKNDDKVGKCYWKDETSPLIEEILASDVLIIASPIFFTEPTSHYRALIERLIYCIVSFERGNVFKDKINVGLFYTIEYPKAMFEKNVRPHLKQSESLLEMFNGEVNIYTSRIITKNERNKSLDNPELESKIKKKENEFAEDLDNAFEIAVKLCK